MIMKSTLLLVENQESNFEPLPTLDIQLKFGDTFVADEGTSSEVSETINGVDHSEDINAFQSRDRPQQGSSDMREVGSLSPVASGNSIDKKQSPLLTIFRKCRRDESSKAQKFKTFFFFNNPMVTVIL